MQSNTEKTCGLVLVDLTEPLTQQLIESRKRFGLPGRIVGVKLLVDDGANIQEIQFRDSDLLRDTGSDGSMSRLSRQSSDNENKDTQVQTRNNVIPFESQCQEPW